MKKSEQNGCKRPTDNELSDQLRGHSVFWEKKIGRCLGEKKCQELTRNNSDPVNLIFERVDVNVMGAQCFAN